MTDETDIRKLNAIVGAALKALAENGADDETLGAFAANHRSKVAEILGCSSAQPQAPDLLSLVTQAVTQAMANIPELKGVSKKEKRAKRISVLIANQRTSVTISPTTVARLIEAKGNKKQAREFIEELANKAPQDSDNRSKWVEARLLSFLSYDPKAEGAGTAQRH